MRRRSGNKNPNYFLSALWAGLVSRVKWNFEIRMPYYILSVFLSAFLIFQVQPMIAKYILREHPEVKVQHIRGDGVVFSAASLLVSVSAPPVDQPSLFS